MAEAIRCDTECRSVDRGNGAAELALWASLDAETSGTMLCSSGSRPAVPGNWRAPAPPPGISAAARLPEGCAAREL